MRYIYQHIHSIIATYSGKVPLTHFLKLYYKQQPKLGSRDRKILSEMAYCSYRCSKGFAGIADADTLVRACLYICDTESTHVLRMLPEAWQQTKANSLADKLALLQQEGISFDINKLVSFEPALSAGIDAQSWLLSMLRQPSLFIRLRKDVSKQLSLLQAAGIAYHMVTETCIALPNGSAIEKILQSDAYVVQDASSQQTGTYFNAQAGEQWWDACSGAGGKSLLLTDTSPAIQLTVSDKRASILHNLQERFKQYRHKAPVQYILDTADAAATKAALGDKQFDNIICDVPCTGAGTWARTPEQLYYFDQTLIDTLSSLQCNIASNAAQYLKPGGRLIYITCSVFTQENEGVVQKLVADGLQLKGQHLINGIANKADSMFVAVLVK